MPSLGPSKNTAAAVLSHHAYLAASVDEAVRALHEAATAGSGDTRQARDDVVRLVRTEILPHAQAEELTYYAAGAELPRIALLVAAMKQDHRRLEALAKHIEVAETALATCELATAFQVLLEAHIATENDLLLPALIEDGVNLEPHLGGAPGLIRRPPTTAPGG
jgi:triphosphoribosyl-dephospho-CoA synthetase